MGLLNYLGWNRSDSKFDFPLLQRLPTWPVIPNASQQDSVDPRLGTTALLKLVLVDMSGQLSQLGYVWLINLRNSRTLLHGILWNLTLWLRYEMFVDTFRTPQGHNQSKPFESYQVSCWNFWTLRRVGFRLIYSFTINGHVFHTFSHARKWPGLDTELCGIFCDSLSYFYSLS